MIRKTRSWIIMGSVFIVCHAHCTLNTSFVDFGVDVL